MSFDLSHAASLFQPVQHMQPWSRFEGSGHWLSVVRRIVELHGGKVQPRSVPGAGSVAELPLDPAPAQAGTGR